jgi:hypothetical protein
MSSREQEPILTIDIVDPSDTKERCKHWGITIPTRNNNYLEDVYKILLNFPHLVAFVVQIEFAPSGKKRIVAALTFDDHGCRPVPQLKKKFPGLTMNKAKKYNIWQSFASKKYSRLPGTEALFHNINPNTVAQYTQPSEKVLAEFPTTLSKEQVDKIRKRVIESWELKQIEKEVRLELEEKEREKEKVREKISDNIKLILSGKPPPPRTQLSKQNSLFKDMNLAELSSELLLVEGELKALDDRKSNIILWLNSDLDELDRNTIIEKGNEGLKQIDKNIILLNEKKDFINKLIIPLKEKLERMEHLKTRGEDELLNDSKESSKEELSRLEDVSDSEISEADNDNIVKVSQIEKFSKIIRNSFTIFLMVSTKREKYIFDVTRELQDEYKDLYSKNIKFKNSTTVELEDDISKPIPGISNVYLIWTEGTKLYKIGHSINVRSRVETLQTANGLLLLCLACCPGDSNTETSLHNKFKRYRNQKGKGGSEWFTFEDKQVQEVIKEYALIRLHYSP